MLHLQTVLPNTLELLMKLSSQPEFADLRLVGGTSLALQYGHRQSVDLDFFGKPDVTQDEILSSIGRIGTYRLRNRTNNILQLVVDNIMVDVVDYSQYTWIDTPVCVEGLKLASPKDIAAMKINAIEGRGSRKDFIDIYILLQHYTMEELLQFYAQKYPNYSNFRAILSLTYFEDAEKESMPKMFITDTWDDIKAAITSAVKNYQAN